LSRFWLRRLLALPRHLIPLPTDEFKFYLEDTSARALIVPAKDSDEARAAAGDEVLIVKPIQQ
jgi:hypothetical protein